jgi:hypothetical protein
VLCAGLYAPAGRCGRGVRGLSVRAVRIKVPETLVCRHFSRSGAVWHSVLPTECSCYDDYQQHNLSSCISLLHTLLDGGLRKYGQISAFCCENFQDLCCWAPDFDWNSAVLRQNSGFILRKLFLLSSFHACRGFPVKLGCSD